MPKVVEYESDSDPHPPRVYPTNYGKKRQLKPYRYSGSPARSCNTHWINDRTYEWHTPKQGITLMVDSGAQMRSRNLNRSLIEHNIILRVEHAVAVPTSLCQEVCNNRAEHAGLVIHGKHGLPSMYLTN